MNKKFALLFLLLTLLSFTYSLEVSARSFVYSDELQAIRALVDELLAELVPKKAVVQESYSQYIVLNVGRLDGVRQGQRFEVYQAHTARYLGLVEIKSVRSRNADAIFIDKRAEVSENDVAEEVVGGRVAVYSFLDRHGIERRLSRSLQELFIYNLGRQAGYDVVERIDIDRILQELQLSYTGLLDESTSREAGHLLGADYIVVGAIQERVDELLITVRMNDIESGLTLATAMVGLSKTSSVMDQLKEILVLQEVTQVDRISSITVSPKGPIYLFPQETIQLQALVRDEDGFIDYDSQVSWSMTHTNIELSSIRGRQVMLTGKEPGRVQVRASTDTAHVMLDVIVQEEPYLAKIFIGPEEVELFMGDSQTFQVEGKDQYGDVIAVDRAEWQILPNIGQLSRSTGTTTTLTAHKEGIITLQVRASGLSVTAKITVKPPPPSLHPLSLAQGDLFS